MYIEGGRVEENRVLAYALYSLAAEGGSLNAQENLPKLEVQMSQQGVAAGKRMFSKLLFSRTPIDDMQFLIQFGLDER